MKPKYMDHYKSSPMNVQDEEGRNQEGYQLKSLNNEASNE